MFGDEEDPKEDAPKPDDPSLSEQDGALTYGDDSSYGDSHVQLCFCPKFAEAGSASAIVVVHVALLTRMASIHGTFG
jgi:hypothetical protein